MGSKPLWDHKEHELLDRLRKMYAAGNYASSPNDITRELDRRAARREGRVAIWTSVVGVVISIVAVLLSAYAVVQGAQR